MSTAERVMAWVVALIVSSSAAASTGFVPTPKVDDRGFIDVWQLRRDVASVEAMMPETVTQPCSLSDPPGAQNRGQGSVEMPTCSSHTRQEQRRYRQAIDAFNHAWLPVLMGAIGRGDTVAEVILRQCATTAILDRTQIESNCDPSPKRRFMAVRRLKEIGFAPAFDQSHQPQTYVNGHIPAANVYKLILDSYSQGVFVFDNELTQNRAIAKDSEELENVRRDKVIEAAVQEAPRAFILPVGQLSTLRLNRKPWAPTEPTWGRRTYEGGDNEFATNHLWRSGPYSTYPYKDGSFAGKDDYKFLLQLHDLLASTERNIDRYLKQDPRWAVFLLHRIGHNEWVPDGIMSGLGTLEPEWQGQWILQKTYVDWSRSESRPMRATIVTAGDSASITYYMEDQSQTKDRHDTVCRLRYSGGVSKLPPDGADGFSLMRGVIGYRAVTSPQNPLVDSERDLFESLEPLNRHIRFRQVLVQCPEGEWFDTDRARFLFLSGDTLLELVRDQGESATTIVRHYRRAGPAKVPAADPVLPYPLYTEGQDLLSHIAGQYARAQAIALAVQSGDIHRIIDSLHQTRIELLYYNSLNAPANVKSLMERDGIVAELTAAYRADHGDTLFRFNILIILNNKLDGRKSERLPDSERKAIANLLVDALADSSSWNRTEAVWGLRRLPPEERILKAAMSALRDSDRNVRGEANATVNELKGKMR